MKYLGFVCLAGQLVASATTEFSRRTLVIPIHREADDRPLVWGGLIQNGRALARVSQMAISTTESTYVTRRSQAAASNPSLGIMIRGTEGEYFVAESFHETMSMIVSPTLPMWFGCELSRHVNAVEFEQNSITLNPSLANRTLSDFVPVGTLQLQAEIAFEHEGVFEGSYPLKISWGDVSASSIPRVQFDRLSALITELGSSLVDDNGGKVIRGRNCYTRLTENLPNLHVRISNHVELVFTPQDYIERTDWDHFCALRIMPDSTTTSDEISSEIVLTNTLLQHVGMVFDYHNNRIGFFDPS